ncbi:MAG: MFS transporter [Candidatus Acidiferrum sp.]|jgi:spermidine synthase
MNSTPVLVLLLFNAALLVASNFFFKKDKHPDDSLFLSVLFFCSGMPALVYQVVWQRALFAIYGVNAQSVAVVVTAFMLGLGIGSLIGGRLSARFPKSGILIFGVAELGVGAFGLISLRIFHWAAAYTAGANLLSVVLFSLLLLVIPTVLMGATLPLLVEHLVMRTNRVGFSVSTLYFVNTFGSAVACYLCATFLLRDFGQSGSVTLAACMNAAVGASAYFYARHKPQADAIEEHAQQPDGVTSYVETAMSLGTAMLLAALSGFIALGFEIAWFRVFALASSDRAPAFALLLSTYLAGIAAGSFLSEKLSLGKRQARIVYLIGGVLVLAGALSVYLPPLVATLMAHGKSFLLSAPAFFVVAGLAGSVLPLLCSAAISPDERAGRRVSLVYIANILGSAAGSLGIGFVLMQHFTLLSIALGLAFAAALAGAALLIFAGRGPGRTPVWAIALMIAAMVAIPPSRGMYTLLFERLIFGTRAEAHVPFLHVVENRNGVIGVTQDGAVFGGGVYDGYFNVDPFNDTNLVVRAYALGAFCPSPKRILVIGLATGSWAQIFANQPQLEHLDAVEINPGYLELIPQYAMVRSFLQNPKVHVYVDDGRRWLVAHPEARYDAIIANNSFNWRDHSTGLLSVEYLNLIREHLSPRGVYYFNSTESDETIATALQVFPYGLRVINFAAVSDSPMRLDKDRWMDVLRNYKMDGITVFDPANPAAQRVLAAYMALADTVNAPPRFLGMESADSLRVRLKGRLIITDDNMGEEWRGVSQIPWH